MPEQREKILAKALKLSPLERAALVEDLLSSFEFSSRKAVDALWVQEAGSGTDAYERGVMTAMPAGEVFGKIQMQKTEEKL